MAAARGVTARLALGGKLGLAGDTVLLALGVGEFAGRGRLLRGLALEVEVVVPAIDPRAQPAELHDAVHPAQHIAVMADHDGAARPAFEHLGHQSARLGVEIVRRLVQDQQVRRARQEARQRHAGDLPAAQARRRPIEVQVRQAHLRQRRLKPGLQAPVRRIQVFAGPLPLGDPPQPRQGFAQVQQALDARARRGLHGLAQQADAALHRERASAGRPLAGDDLKQRGLAHAVASHEPGAFGPEGECQVFEERPAVRGLRGEAIERDEGGHGRPGLRGRSGRGGCPWRRAWSWLLLEMLI
jgi:hypothetical protein